MIKYFVVFFFPLFGWLLSTSISANVNVDRATGNYTVDAYGSKASNKPDWSNLTAQVIEDDREEWMSRKQQTKPPEKKKPTPLPPKNPQTPLPKKKCPTFDPS